MTLSEKLISGARCADTALRGRVPAGAARILGWVGASWSWRAASLSFVAVVVVALGGFFTTIVLIDPYDSGRLPSILRAGVSDTDPRTANVSRGRDLRFNAGIFGNSRAMLLDPVRLFELTGLRFVHLTTPSSGAREQAVLLQYFLRFHDDVGAVLMMLDQRWCSRDPAIPPQVPFPFELYGDDLHYFSSMLNTRVVVIAYKRIMLALGKRPATDPNGFLDFEADRTWGFNPTTPDRPRVDLAPAPGAPPPFPAIHHIADALSKLPNGTPVVLFWPPFYYTELPESGSDEARVISACKFELVQDAASHASWRIADFLMDTPMSRDPANFLDGGHYRRVIAQNIEQQIAMLLADIRGAGR